MDMEMKMEMGGKDGNPHLSKVISKRGRYHDWRRCLAVALFGILSGGHVAGLFSCHVVDGVATAAY